MKNVNFFADYNINIVSQSYKVTNKEDLQFFFNEIKDIQNCNILDVGANKGYYALLSTLKTDLRYCSFEPLKKTYTDYLLKNIELNNVKDKGTTHNFGLSDTCGEFTLWYDNTENATLQKDIEKEQELKDKRIKNPKRESFLQYKSQSCKFNTLDLFLAENKNIFNDISRTKIHAVKIDTEGAEDLVIKGGINFFKRNLPILFLETEDRHCKRFGTTVEKRIQDLKSLGYTNVIQFDNNHLLKV